MTDGQTLLAVFVLLYLVECLRLVPSGLWMVAGAEKSRWGVIRPWSRLHIAGGSPLLLSPLPPMQSHVTALPWLFVPADDTLLVRLSDSMTVRVSWEQLSLRADDTTLHLDATTHLRMPSPTVAELWRQRLEEWRGLAPDHRRRAFLKHARGSLDTNQATARGLELAQHVRFLKLISTLIFLCCFGVISVLYHRFGDSQPVLIASAAMLLLQLTQSWLFLRITRKQKRPIPHRRWRALGIACLPQLAMRATDVICLADDAEPQHPLAWRTLLEDQEWLRHARQFWREARYVPGWPATASLPLEAEALRAFFAHEGITAADYDPPATGKLPTCPRCGAEFQASITHCKDCGGVELRS